MKEAAANATANPRSSENESARPTNDAPVAQRMVSLVRIAARWSQRSSTHLRTEEPERVALLNFICGKLTIHELYRACIELCNHLGSQRGVSLKTHHHDSRNALRGGHCARQEQQARHENADSTRSHWRGWNEDLFSQSNADRGRPSADRGRQPNADRRRQPNLDLPKQSLNAITGAPNAAARELRHANRLEPFIR